MKIFEKFGVTNNSDDIVNSIAFNVNKAIIIDIPHFSDIHGIEKYQNVKIAETKYGNNVTFYIDRKHNTCLDWLSDKTQIKVNNVICSDYEYNLLRTNNDLLTYSSYEIYDGKVVGYFEFTFFHVYDEYSDGIPDIYFHNTKYTHNQLKSIIQHELNHIHKHTKIKRNDDYDNAYEKLVDICSSDNSITSQIAHILYMTCVQDERNAHVEQFYREAEKQDPNTSQIWKKINKISNDLDFYEQKINDGLDVIIYNKLKDICLVMFNINTKNSKTFCQKLFKFIRFNIDKTKRLMLRTLNLYESTNEIYYNKIIRHFNV